MAEFTLDNLNDKNESTIETKEQSKPQHRKVVLANLNALSADDLVDVDPKQFVSESEDNKPKSYAETMLGDLDSAIDRNKKDITKMEEDFKENIGSMLEEKGIDTSENGDKFVEEVIATKTEEDTPTIDIIEEDKKDEESTTDIKEHDMDDDLEKEESLIFDNDDSGELNMENEVTAEEKEEEEKKILSNKIKQNVINTIGVFHNKFDLTKFKVKQNAISVSKLLKQNGAEIKTADWVLYSAGKAITCSALSALEINALNPESSQRNKLNTLLDIFKIIYNHVIDANKPEFETWLKKTNFFDISHIYFALYKATFAKSNFVNYVCTNEKCKEATIVDINFDDMVVYKNDEIKEKVKNILRKDTTSENREEYDADLYQISDQYAVALKTPSLWNAFIELSSLDEEFTKKYSSELDLYAYIDNVFFIDENTLELVPVDMGIVEKNQAKTSLNRVKTLHKVIGTLTPDQYQQLLSYAKDYNVETEDLTYRIPEYTCPVCKTKIDAIAVDARELLFYRHQLGTFRAI